MSQAGVLNSVSSNPLPPTIPTSFLTNSGTGVPASNQLSITGGTSTDNNLNGIETDANPNLSKFVHVKLTNRATGSITTTDGSTVNLVTLPLGSTPGVYAISGSICGYIPAASQGGGYFFEGVTRTDGATATEFTGQFTNFQEDSAIQTAFVLAATSGNNFVLEITGIAATSINWVGVVNFTFVS
jgi:hypothetical protein